MTYHDPLYLTSDECGCLPGWPRGLPVTLPAGMVRRRLVHTLGCPQRAFPGYGPDDLPEPTTPPVNAHRKEHDYGPSIHHHHPPQ